MKATRLLAIVLLLLSGHAIARPRILCAVGDSLVAGGPILGGNPSWLGLLQTERIGQRFGVINVGVGGYTVAQATALFEGEYKGHGCTHMVILVGTNDLAQSTSAATIFSGIQALIASAQADRSGNPSGINVTVLTPPPRGGSAGWDSTKETQRLALRTSILAIGTAGVAKVDLETMGCTGDPVEMCAAFRTADMLHFNGTPVTGGSQAVADLINAVVSW